MSLSKAQTFKQRKWEEVKFLSLFSTRLALASILGPFGVHLLQFTLDTHPGSFMHYLRLLEFQVRICDASQITTDTRRT